MTSARIPTASRHRWRRRALFVAMVGLAVGAVIGTAAVVLMVANDDPERDRGLSAGPPADSFRLASGRAVNRAVLVPEIVGLGEAQAVKALGMAGLVANVRYDYGAPLTGKVLHSDPEAGSEVTAGSVIILSISLYRLPMPEPEDEQAPAAFGRLLERNPDVFFGTYLDETGGRVVAFAPGADPAEWQDRLTEALEGQPFRTDRCSQTRASLRRIQDEIAAKEWTDNKRLRFNVGVDTRTCTVRVGSDLLTPSEIRTLVDRYGTAISFDTSEGSAGMLVPLIGRQG